MIMIKTSNNLNGNITAASGTRTIEVDTFDPSIAALELAEVMGATKSHELAFLGQLNGDHYFGLLPKLVLDRSLQEYFEKYSF